MLKSYFGSREFNLVFHSAATTGAIKRAEMEKGGFLDHVKTLGTFILEHQP